MEQYFKFVGDTYEYMVNGNIYKLYDKLSSSYISNIKCGKHAPGNKLYWSLGPFKPSTKEAYDAQLFSPYVRCIYADSSEFSIGKIYSGFPNLGSGTGLIKTSLPLNGGVWKFEYCTKEEYDKQEGLVTLDLKSASTYKCDIPVTMLSSIAWLKIVNGDNLRGYYAEGDITWTTIDNYLSKGSMHPENNKYRQNFRNEGFVRIDFEEALAKAPHLQKLIGISTHLSMEQILEKAKRDYPIGTVFKDKVNNYSFTVQSHKFDTFGNKNQLYVNVNTNRLGNKTARLYKDGEWAEIIDNPLVNDIEQPKFKKGDIVRFKDSTSQNARYFSKGLENLEIYVVHPEDYSICESDKSTTWSVKFHEVELQPQKDLPSHWKIKITSKNLVFVNKFRAFKNNSLIKQSDNYTRTFGWEHIEESGGGNDSYLATTITDDQFIDFLVTKGIITTGFVKDSTDTSSTMIPSSSVADIPKLWVLKITKDNVHLVDKYRHLKGRSSIQKLNGDYEWKYIYNDGSGTGVIGSHNILTDEQFTRVLMFNNIDVSIPPHIKDYPVMPQDTFKSISDIPMYRFLTKEEFIDKGLWDKNGYPKGWNNNGKMNHYMGQDVPIEATKRYQEKLTDKLYHNGWSFKPEDFILKSSITLSCVGDGALASPDDHIVTIYRPNKKKLPEVEMLEVKQRRII